MYSGALTTITTVQGQLSAPERDNEARIVLLVSAVSEAMAREAGRTWEYAASVVDLVASDGGAFLYLPRAPILSIASIEILDVAGTTLDTLDTTSYRIRSDGAAGMIEGAFGSTAILAHDSVELAPVLGSEGKRYRVTYAGGFVTPWQVDGKNASALSGIARSLPYDLELACVNEVLARLQDRGRNPLVTSRSNEASSVSYRETSGFLLPETLNVARRYSFRW